MDPDTKSAVVSISVGPGYSGVGDGRASEDSEVSATYFRSSVVTSAHGSVAVQGGTLFRSLCRSVLVRRLQVFQHQVLKLAAWTIVSLASSAQPASSEAMEM